MREIDVSIIEKAVEELFISANAELPASLENLIRNSKETETNKTAKNIFCDMCKNLDVARENEIPICQDTGMAVLFIEVGQDVHFVGGSLNDAKAETPLFGHLMRRADSLEKTLVLGGIVGRRRRGRQRMRC